MRQEKLRMLPELHRAVHRIGLFIDHLMGAECTQAEAIILAFLHEQRKATMSELHRAFGHKRSTLTSVVQRLVSRGLAKRNLSPDDRRSFVVTLSKKGTTVAMELHRRLAALEAAALKNIPDRDVARLGDIMTRLSIQERGH